MLECDVYMPVIYIKTGIWTGIHEVVLIVVVGVDLDVPDVSAAVCSVRVTCIEHSFALSQQD